MYFKNNVGSNSNSLIALSIRILTINSSVVIRCLRANLLISARRVGEIHSKNDLGLVPLSGLSKDKRNKNTWLIALTMYVHARVSVHIQYYLQFSSEGNTHEM